MATLSESRAVKSLNTGPGSQRFVFKTPSQKIEEIEIDVYRSLDKLKAEPSEGSTFFMDCLVEWRELNTAEDFISFYEEMMPFVQTLPLVLLHKELIFSQLLSRLQIESRLSIEPILRLLAALSRDLLEDFIPFLPRLADALVCLLESGGEKVSEIIEQIFTSWSYIQMYLQKYLIRDIMHLLKVTVRLRYHSEKRVRELMAEAISFVLRNAPKEQLIRGIRKTMLEVVKKPVFPRKHGVSNLLYFITRGATTRFHSRAEQVLQLLTDESLFSIGNKFDQGCDTIAEVVIATFKRFAEEIDPKELNLMWNCLYQEIDLCLSNRCLFHLSHLLTLLISTVQFNHGRRVTDYQPLLERVDSLAEKFVFPSDIMTGEDHLSDVAFKVLQLMSCVLDGLNSIHDMPAISSCSLQWASVFKLRNSSCLTFIGELLNKEPCIFYAFKVNILSAMNAMIETSQEEIISLLLSFCERLQKDPLSCNFLDGTSEGLLSSIQGFLQGAISSWVGLINDIILGRELSSPIGEPELASFWAVVRCYPHMMDTQSNHSTLMDVLDVLHRLLIIEYDNIAGIPKHTWQSLAGAALSSYCKYGKKDRLQETSKVLWLAKSNKTSVQLLSAVADYLDYVYGPTLEACKGHKKHPELVDDKIVNALDIFGDNLCNPDKEIRIATLRILCHYEPQGCECEDQPPQKKLKTEFSQTCLEDSDVLQLLLLIETTPLSISTSKKVNVYIDRMIRGLSSGRISEAYLPILLSGLIGIFHNRFSDIWTSASKCLAFLIEKHVKVVWDKFAHYLEQCQSLCQASHGDGQENVKLSEESHDLVEWFNLFVASAFDSTPYETILSLLLQSLQRIPSVAESHSRGVIPLFLKFLGYNMDELSLELFNSDACKSKEWKHILKEWLILLKLMRNSKAFYLCQFVKDVLQTRLLDDNDAEIQMKVLDCLLNWKDEFLLPYEQHLRNLISAKNLREELTSWSLSRDTFLIEEGHRSHLVPLVILLLMPKVRNLKTLASRKHKSINHRRAVLRFIAQLDVSEIPLFFLLLIKPLHAMSKEADGASNLFWALPRSPMLKFQPLNILRCFTVEKILSLSWKKRYGFLHVIEDILEVFDESRVRPFLDLLMGCVVRILQSCLSSIDTAKGAESLAIQYPSLHLKSQEEDNVEDLRGSIGKQFKDLRSFCIKIVSVILNKYDDHDFGSEFWDMFFTSVRPLIDNFKQEGSSSEKPSSLFSCFLAMSRSQHLVSLLCREKNLVPDIFSILTVTTASEAIIYSVLKFIENLLCLDEEMNDEDNDVKKVLLPNLEELVSSLHFVFLGNNLSKRKLAKSAEESHIKIFKLLSKYIKAQVPAVKFVAVLLQFLSRRVKDYDVHTECLQIIGDLIPVVGDRSTSDILSSISQFLITAELDMRLSIWDLLDALAKTDPSLVPVAMLLRELNATSTTDLGDLDYDTIVSAYEKIGVDFFPKVQEHHALVVLSHFVHDMSSEDLVLRHSAYRSLLSFVDFSAMVLVGQNENNGSTQEDTIKDSLGSWTRACIHRIMNKFLLKHIGKAMKAESSFRKEWIELLREMVLKLPELAGLNSLTALCSKDAEQDFFNNIIHLQKHRRAKALSQFRNVISNSNMPEGILNKVFVPLFFNMLFDGRDGKGEHIKTACVEALASISAHVGWKCKCALLTRCFREMNINVDKLKILSKLICSILDNFHFSQISSMEEVEGSSDAISYSETTRAVLPKCSSSVRGSDMHTFLHRTVLPKIQRSLSSDSDKINVNLSVAALKVLKLLPGNIMASQLPTIIHGIANRLKSRVQSIRDEARLALAACLKELGLEYFQFLLKVLQSTLKRGFELHVLGYTVNFLLSNSIASPMCGKLDYCLEDILSVVENDIFGDVSEQKEVEKIASKMKETMKQSSFETLEFMARSVTLKAHAFKLLSPVTANMQKHLTPKVKTKLQTMLDSIAEGIQGNPSVAQTDLLIFIQKLIEDGIKEEIGQGGNFSCMEANIHTAEDGGGKTNSLGRVSGSKLVLSQLLTVFSLKLLWRSIKGQCDKNNEELLSMLDSIVKLLGVSLRSSHEGILCESLKCLTELVKLKLPLPSLSSQGEKIKLMVLNVLQGSVNANSPLMQSCLKLLTVLLQSSKMTLSSDQLHLLIQFPLFVDLERNDSSIALQLLKAIFSRKLMVPEIRGVALRVAELMITSQKESTRKTCSIIFLQFLRDYRISVKDLQDYLDFLLKNLSYEYPTGRISVLEMLLAIMKKFPPEFVEKHAKSLFIRLVQCLANDTDREVRKKSGTAIKCLIERASTSLRESIVDICLSWYMNEKRQLQCLGAQAIGLLVEATDKEVVTEKDESFIQEMNKILEKHMGTIVAVCRNFLQSAVDVVSNAQAVDQCEEALPSWKEAYFSIVMLEKILSHFGGLNFDRNHEDIWEAICELLLHPHTWLRNSSSRLVNFYLSTATKAIGGNHEMWSGTFPLMRPSKLFMIAVSSCCQLKTQAIDEYVGMKITENLAYSICGIHILMGNLECSNSHNFWSSLEPDEQGLFLKAFQLLDSRKGRGMLLDVVSGVHDVDDGDQSKKLRDLLVSNLLKRMGKIALQMEAIQMECIFNCFKEISLKIDQVDCCHYAFDMLLPIYKVCEGFAGKSIPDKSKQLAEEVRRSIQSTLDDKFIAVYNEIRKKLEAKRRKRKQEEKQMAVIDPMRSAKRKLRIAEKHRANKKRRILKAKMR